jgi:hypothetical protein
LTAAIISGPIALSFFSTLAAHAAHVMPPIDSSIFRPTEFCGAEFCGAECCGAEFCGAEFCRAENSSPTADAADALRT